jgi:hypothetical protein
MRLGRRGNPRVNPLKSLVWCLLRESSDSLAQTPRRRCETAVWVLVVIPFNPAADVERVAHVVGGATA